MLQQPPQRLTGRGVLHAFVKGGQGLQGVCGKMRRLLRCSRLAGRPGA